MTPGEIDKLYNRFDERHAATSDYLAFIKTVREASTQAYEEAARVADEISEGDHAGSYGAILCAQAIRALRDKGEGS